MTPLDAVLTYAAVGAGVIFVVAAVRGRRR